MPKLIEFHSKFTQIITGYSDKTQVNYWKITNAIPILKTVSAVISEQQELLSQATYSKSRRDWLFHPMPSHTILLQNFLYKCFSILWVSTRPNCFCLGLDSPDY